MPLSNPSNGPEGSEIRWVISLTADRIRYILVKVPPKIGRSAEICPIVPDEAGTGQFQPPTSRHRLKHAHNQGVNVSRAVSLGTSPLERSPQDWISRQEYLRLCFTKEALEQLSSATAQHSSILVFIMKEYKLIWTSSQFVRRVPRGFTRFAVRAHLDVFEKSLPYTLYCSMCRSNPHLCVRSSLPPANLTNQICNSQRILQSLQRAKTQGQSPTPRILLADAYRSSSTKQPRFWPYKVYNRHPRDK